MFRIGVLALFFAASTTWGASQGWFIRNAAIERISVFSDGAYHGMHLYFRAEPQHVEEMMLGSSCPPTWEAGLTQPNENKVVTWRSGGSPGPKAQLMYSTALAAQAQGLKVDIWVKTSCLDGSARQWGYMWEGLSIAGY